MPLPYISSCSSPPSVPRKALDDNYIRAPIVLAPEQVNPLTTTMNAEYTSRTWRLATVGKNKLVEGHRLENALWRVWAQQRLGLRRVEDMGIDWERLTAWKHKSLLGPVVISQETCIRSIEISIASMARNAKFDISSPAFGVTPTQNNDLTVPNRPCLRRRSFSPGDALSLVNNLEEPYMPSPARSHRVVFNKCVVQCIIKQDWENSDQDDVSEFELDTPSVEEAPHTSQAFSFPRFVEDFDTPYDEEPNISRAATVIASDYFPPSIEPLPPMQLHPIVAEEEKDANVVFVPPPGMEDLQEAELLPYEPVTTLLEPTKSSDGLTQEEEEDIAMESQLEDLCAREPESTAPGTGPLSDEPVITMNVKRRKRRGKGLFLLGDESVETEPRGRDRTARSNDTISSAPLGSENMVNEENASLMISIDQSDSSTSSQDLKSSDFIQRRMGAMLDQLSDTGGKIGQIVANLWS